MASGMLGTAITGLQAFQRSLETTSHNISNVNTEGYSRQRVDLVTKKEQMIGVGYLGTGVSINNISRSYDQFLTTQLRSSTSAFGDVDKYRELSIQVDDLLADPAVGIAPEIKKFFNSVNEVTDDPSSIAARQVMLSQGGILTSHFKTMNSRFEEMRSLVNDDLTVMTKEITSFAATIAELNQKIANAQGQASGDQQPNDLLDQRDTVLNQLAELIDVSVVPSNSNMVSVFIGKGQALVLDVNASKISTKPSDLDPSKLDIVLESPSGMAEVISNSLSGGAISGALRFRNEILDPAQQQLGRVAASIAMEVNNIHELGFDLDGNGPNNGTGATLFFSGMTSVPVTDSPQNSVTSNLVLAVTFDKTKLENIDFSDFKLEKLTSGVPNTYKFTREADDTSYTLNEVGGFLVPSGTDVLPGITIEVASGSAAVGDGFLIRPTYSAASNIGVNLTDPRQIAIATNAAKDNDGNSYVVLGPMPGDNRNGLLLAGLENKLGMIGGTASFHDSYSLVVSEVGVLTKSAKVGSTAQETLLNNAKSAWGNVSGVNLDEEAANLVKFQQSYQAAAQMISVSGTLFDSLLGAVN